jgi:hypothetical protein
MRGVIAAQNVPAAFPLPVVAQPRQLSKHIQQRRDEIVLFRAQPDDIHIAQQGTHRPRNMPSNGTLPATQ